MKAEQFIYLDPVDIDGKTEAMNFIHGSDIHVILFLYPMHIRKNISVITLAKKLNYNFLMEFICGISRCKEYTPLCKGDGKNCPIEKVLKKMGVRYK